MAVGYRDDCGGVPLQEEYTFRQVWCSFLAISNISDKPKALSAVIGHVFETPGFHTFTISSTEAERIPLPKAPIPPNATALISLALILPSFHSFESENWSETYDDERHVQVVRHEGASSANLDEILVLGNQILTSSISYELDGNETFQDLHNFDLSNMYTIDRFWACGSCPHLFFIAENVSYAREILAHCNTRIGIDQFTAPRNITKIIIAEIEDEITEIVSLAINGKIILENTYLKKDQYIQILVDPEDHIEIIGQYIPYIAGKEKRLYGGKRNELVGKFLMGKNNSLTNAYTRII